MRRGGSAAIAFDIELTDSTDPSPVDGTIGRSPIATSSTAASGASSPRMRALIVLHHYLDLPLPEVAAALGIPLGTAKSRLHRALRQMRAALDADARPATSSRRAVRHDARRPLRRRPSPMWLAGQTPGTACPTTSTRSSADRARLASGRRGRASKGGSPCRQRFASRPFPGSPGSSWSSPSLDRARRGRADDRLATAPLPPPFGPARNGADRLRRIGPRHLRPGPGDRRTTVTDHRAGERPRPVLLAGRHEGSSSCGTRRPSTSAAASR